MTREQGEIIPDQEEQNEQAVAWLDAVLRIGDDVSSMAESARHKRHHFIAPTVPQYAGVTVPASGIAVLDLGMPSAGRIWEVRALACVDASNPTGVLSGGLPIAVSGTRAAGAAGSVALPNGASCTGFDVDFQGPAAAVSSTVTVTNLSTANGSSGTLSTSLTIPTSGLVNLPRAFPDPLPALNSGVGPTLNVPVIASGPAYSMTIYGRTAVTGATPGIGFWYTGLPSVYGPQNARWQIPQLPTIDTRGDRHITVPAGEHLFAVLTGCTPGHLIVARADVIEELPGRVPAVRAV